LGIEIIQVGNPLISKISEGGSFSFSRLVGNIAKRGGAIYGI